MSVETRKQRRDRLAAELRLVEAEERLMAVKEPYQSDLRTAKRKAVEAALKSNGEGCDVGEVAAAAAKQWLEDNPDRVVEYVEAKAAFSEVQRDYRENHRKTKPRKEGDAVADPEVVEARIGVTS